MRRPARAQKRALFIAARVQDLSDVQPAHVAGLGRNGGELHEGAEHLRRVAADGRLRLGPAHGACINQCSSEVMESFCCVSVRRPARQCTQHAFLYSGLAGWLAGSLVGWLGIS